MGVFREWFESQFERLVFSFDVLEEKLMKAATAVTTPFTEKYEDFKLVLASKITEGLLNGLIQLSNESMTDFIRITKSPQLDEDKMIAIFSMEPAEVKEAGLGEKIVYIFAQMVSIFAAAGAIADPEITRLKHKYYTQYPTEVPPLTDAVRMYFRHALTEDQLNEIFLAFGYKQDYIDGYKTIMQYYPPAPDLITWQAREVYEPEMVKKYGLDDELDAVEREPFYEAGINDAQIRNYWIAHWQHPDWFRVREMLFRTDFTETDMWEWFRMVEIPPYWRDRYIATAYNPTTRVDLRRLYQDGQADRERVKRGYMELGYNEEHAEELTKWTENTYAPKERELAKEEVLKNYRIGDATADTVKEMLIRLGYTEDQITWILVYEDYKVTEDEKTQEAETIITEVINGSITLEKAVEGFGTLKLSQKRMNSYIARAKREARKLTHIPPIATLKKWYREGIISAEQFSERMYAHKVAKEDIDRYMKEGGE